MGRIISIAAAIFTAFVALSAAYTPPRTMQAAAVSKAWKYFSRLFQGLEKFP
jgi:hypothetical protein